ncbi:uncharacterized protein [Amphiura filiformis]|uniref:uncharacterized protein n=1 Tax=Amphiura filiformis TaxID=82378 RepID=UPI003B211E69
MDSKFPGGFGPGFPPLPFWLEGGQPFHSPYERQLTIPQALRVTELEWNEIKTRMIDLNSALTKLLGKSTERPTLRKILTTLDEKRDTLIVAENKVVQMFFNALSRLEKIKNAMPIGQLLTQRIDINAIFNDTTVHSTIHEDITDLIKSGVTISSRFRATVSVIPRLLDCFSSRDPRTERPRSTETSSRARSPSPSQPKDSQHKTRADSGEKPNETPHSAAASSKPTQGQEKVRRESGENPYQTPQFEEEVEVLLGDPDAEFQMLQICDDGWNMQRRRGYQLVYERKCAETNQLRRENQLLLKSLQEKEQEVAKLKSEVQANLGSVNDERHFGTKFTEQQPHLKKNRSLELLLNDIRRRVEDLEADREGNNTLVANYQSGKADQLEDHLKYFRRRLAEFKPEEQTNFIYNSSNFAAGYFDDRGGFLEMEALNVSLFVPPGAIQAGERTEVYIYIKTDGSTPSPKDSSTVLVAPVVQCGPPGLQFHESVVLTFPHCAEDETNWKFQPLTCQSDDQHKAKGEWKGMTTDDAIFMVDNGRTVLLVNHFTFYTLGGEQKEDGSVAKKKMRVGAFGSSFSAGQDSYRLRVRAWDDTKASHDQVLKKEERLSGQQLDDDRPIAIANTGEPVDVNVKNLKIGWKNRYDEPQGQHISFNDLWQPHCLPSCTFDLELEDGGSGDNKDTSPRVKTGVHCKINLQQRKSNDDAVSLRIDVQGITEMEERCSSNQTFSGAVQEKLFGPSDPKYGLSPAAYYRLCEELNMDRGIPMDWRLLAEKLGCNFITIENIKNNKTEEPAKFILKIFFSVWNTTSKEKPSAINFLKNTLLELGLSVAAKIIQDDIEQK